MARQNLELSLPPHLRGAATTIAPIGAGLSGAGVYRVDCRGELFVLKVSSVTESLTDWQRRLRTQQHAAQAGLAPRIEHVDEPRRAVLSAFVPDRSFPAFYGNPATHASALTLLALTIRRVHGLPAPNDIAASDPLAFLASAWSLLKPTSRLPRFVVTAVEAVLSEVVPLRERAQVMSHNDVNPSNLVFDGERLLLLDWETTGPNDPFYDLATISIFLRMDEATCVRLLSAYDGSPVETLPAGFRYNRRLIAALCGSIFLRLSLAGGYSADSDETFESALSLGDFYQRMRAGELSPASPEGQWRFGLALIKTMGTVPDLP